MDAKDDQLPRLSSRMADDHSAVLISVSSYLSSLECF